MRSANFFFLTANQKIANPPIPASSTEPITIPAICPPESPVFSDCSPPGCPPPGCSRVNSGAFLEDNSTSNFLSVFHVDVHFQSVFVCDDFVGNFAVQNARALFKSFFLADGNVAAFVYAFGGKYFDKAVNDCVLLFVDTKR